MKERKFDYVKVIQQLICGSWCDVAFYDIDDEQQMKELKSDIKSYRENEPEPFRIISRRVKHGEVLSA